MDLKILALDETQQSNPSREDLGYWNKFSDRIFSQRYTARAGWHDATIGPFTPYPLNLASTVFHYGQAIFEGCKAFRRPDGHVNLFRPWDHVKRFNRSARRMMMPAVPEEDHLQAIIKLVQLDQAWVPNEPGASLYIRPVMFATDTRLPPGASKSYLHAIMTSPLLLYEDILLPMPIYISDQYPRAVMGGTGDIKAACNYAPTLYLSEAVKEDGYEDVLWLDAIHHRYVEEVGTMNFAVVYNGKQIVTPSLTGTILPGITRDSILKLAPELGYEATETQLDVHDMLADIRSGEITEAFGTGTGSMVASVGKLGHRGEAYMLNNGEVGPVTKRLRQALMDIQFGRVPDERGWTLKIEVE